MLNKFSLAILKVMPLQRTNLNGELYQRSDAVEAQINEALKLDSIALIARATISDHKTPGFLQEECVVALIRASLSHTEKEMAKALFEILLKRCVGFIYRRLKFEDSDRRDDAYSEVVSKLVEKILRLNSNKADFLQVKFWFVLKRLIITTFKECLPDPIEKNSIVIDVEKVVNIGGITNNDPLEDLLAQETSDEAKRILLELSERHLDAFTLRHTEGWPIESRDPEKITLSTYFGVTPRTIRNWLAEGMAVLKKYREGK